MRKSTGINTFNNQKLYDFVLKLETKKQKNQKHYTIPIQLHTRSCNRAMRQENEVKVYVKKKNL